MGDHVQTPQHRVWQGVREGSRASQASPEIGLGRGGLYMPPPMLRSQTSEGMLGHTGQDLGVRGEGAGAQLEMGGLKSERNWPGSGTPGSRA